MVIRREAVHLEAMDIRRAVGTHQEGTATHLNTFITDHPGVIRQVVTKILGAIRQEVTETSGAIRQEVMETLGVIHQADMEILGAIRQEVMAMEPGKA